MITLIKRVPKGFVFRQSDGTYFVLSPDDIKQVVELTTPILLSSKQDASRDGGNFSSQPE